MEIRRFGAIDIGSNAVRLLIANVMEHAGNVQFKKSSLTRIPIRLGEDVFINGVIGPEKQSRLTDAMNAYKYLMAANGVICYRACATSAMREASNGIAVTESIRKETGIEIEIISGSQEAETIYSTHAEDLLDQNRAYLYTDVGGGSTELTLIYQHRTLDSISFPVGTVRLLGDAVAPESWENMKNWIGEKSKGLPRIQIIGSGGNINKISRIISPSNRKIKRSQLETFEKFLRAYTYQERIRVLGLNPDRADVILPATQIFLEVMRCSKASSVIVPTIGISDGIIRELYEDYKSGQMKYCLNRDGILSTGDKK